MNPVVHIVDDDDELRSALTFLFQSRDVVVETYSSGEEFLEKFGIELDGCLLLDVRMKGMSGLELLNQLNLQNVHIPIILLTGHGDVPMAVEAIKNGAHDFIEKPFNDNELVNKVLAAIAVQNLRNSQVDPKSALIKRIESLSTRERQIMNALLSGLPNKVIAYNLQIVPRTVEVHRASMFKKMGVRGAVELANLIAKLSTSELRHTLQA